MGRGGARLSLALRHGGARRCGVRLSSNTSSRKRGPRPARCDLPRRRAARRTSNATIVLAVFIEAIGDGCSREGRDDIKEGALSIRDPADGHSLPSWGSGPYQRLSGRGAPATRRTRCMGSRARGEERSSYCRVIACAMVVNPPADFSTSPKREEHSPVLCRE